MKFFLSVELVTSVKHKVLRCVYPAKVVVSLEVFLPIRLVFQFFGIKKTDSNKVFYIWLLLVSTFGRLSELTFDQAVAIPHSE